MPSLGIEIENKLSLLFTFGLRFSRESSSSLCCFARGDLVMGLTVLKATVNSHDVDFWGNEVLSQCMGEPLEIHP